MKTEKTKSEMRNEIKAMVAGLPNRDYDKCHIIKIGRDYITFVSLYEGSKIQRVSIESFYSTRNLFADAE